MKKLNFVFLSFFILNSCLTSEEKVIPPENLIEKAKFSLILEEIMMVEYQIESEIPSLELNHKIIRKYGGEVLKKYSITETQFEESFDFYCSNYEEMKQIYTTILDNMTKKLNKLQVFKKPL